MPAAWQASGTLLGSTGADITPVWPTHVRDDIGILMASSRVVTETLTTPSGWALLHGPIDVGTTWRTYCFWIRATSNAMTNPLNDWSAAVGEKYGQVHTVRGASTDNSPFAASILAGDATDPIVTTGITAPLANQRIIVAGIANDNLSTTVTVTSTNPAAYTLNNYQDIATGNDAAGWFASALRTTAGATGNITSDFDAAMPAGTALAAAMLDPAPRHPAHDFGSVTNF